MNSQTGRFQQPPAPTTTGAAKSNYSTVKGRGWILLTALFWVLFLACACQRTAPLAPLSPGAKVLAFGDSLTFGTGAGAGESYPSRLAELTGLTVINAGRPGELSAEGAVRLPGLLDLEEPALLILCHGGNDLLRRTGEKEAARQLRSMLDAARSRGIEVVLIGVPRPGLLLDAAPFYQQLAEEYHIPYEGEILSDILAERDLKSDQVHPNAAGYRKLAAAIAKLLHRAGALP